MSAANSTLLESASDFSTMRSTIERAALEPESALAPVLPLEADVVNLVSGELVEPTPTDDEEEVEEEAFACGAEESSRSNSWQSRRLGFTSRQLWRPPAAPGGEAAAAALSLLLERSSAEQSPLLEVHAGSTAAADAGAGGVVAFIGVDTKATSILQLESYIQYSRLVLMH